MSRIFQTTKLRAGRSLVLGAGSVVGTGTKFGSGILVPNRSIVTGVGERQVNALSAGISAQRAQLAGVAAVTAADGYVGAGQLASDEYAPTRMALQWSNPGAAPGAGSRYLWHHSDVDYDVTWAPMGGSPPYRFMAVADNADGFSISAGAPSRNPFLFLWCRVRILAAAFQSGARTYTVYCQDQLGATISRTVVVTQDNGKFLFLESGVGGGGTGTVDSPFSLLNQWYLSSATNAAHAGKICVYNGTFDVDNFDTSITALRVDNAKPRAHVAMPGASAAFNCGANIVSAAGTTDWYWQDITLNGSDSTATNPRVFALVGSVSRAMFNRLSFISPVLGTSNTDNTSCIYSSNSGAKSKQNISLVDLYWEDLPSAANGFSLFDFYGADSTCVLGGFAKEVSAQYGAWPKNANYRVFMAGLDMWDATNTGYRHIFTENGAADTGGIVQAVYCKAFRPTDGIVSQKVMQYGDNNPWGEIYQDRCTIAGRVGVTNGSHEAGGTAVIQSNLIFSDITPKIESTQTLIGNTTGTRADVNTYLDASGNVKTDHALYGKRGATVKEAA